MTPFLNFNRYFLILFCFILFLLILSIFYLFFLFFLCLFVVVFFLVLQFFLVFFFPFFPLLFTSLWLTGRCFTMTCRNRVANPIRPEKTFALKKEQIVFEEKYPRTPILFKMFYHAASLNMLSAKL